MYPLIDEYVTGTSFTDRRCGYVANENRLSWRWYVVGVMDSGQAGPASGTRSFSVAPLQSASATATPSPGPTVTPTATPAPTAVAAGLGYNDLMVPTIRGTFRVHVIKERLSDVTVKTVTANAVDCTADCPASPLADHVRNAGAFAGMNGTYLCPPDYAQCAGKVNTYEYSVYNSDLGTWLNRYAFISPINALATVTNGVPRFYRRINTYDGSAVTAGISNFPILLLGGSVVDTEGEQQDYQKLRGFKGSIGTDGTHIFLALVRNASVTDSAYALQALGVRDAMNLDGGGTSAMYIDGTYKVGPGRLLPNAVVLVRR